METLGHVENSSESQNQQEKIKEKTFEKIDEMEMLAPETTFDLVGVTEDIKPAGILSMYTPKNFTERSNERTESILNSLGLKFSKDITDDPTYAPAGYDLVSYYVAKTDELVTETIKAEHQSWDDHQMGDGTRKLGKLLGFPETAIEYYIKRNQENAKTGASPQKLYPNEYFYAHSPENVQTEFQQYEAKIMPAMQKYCPKSASEIQKKYF